MADSEVQETRQPSPKESPFSIKNLLNIEDKPAKPRGALGSARGVLDGGFFSRLGDLSFPRFDLSTQRLGLSAQYLERASTWWYPYTLSAHLRAGGGKRSSLHIIFANNNNNKILCAHTSSFKCMKLFNICSPLHLLHCSTLVINLFIALLPIAYVDIVKLRRCVLFYRV